MDPTREMKELLRATASTNLMEANQASMNLAKALELPLRKGVMSGDILAGVYSEEQFEPGVAPEFPLDFLTPGTEDRFVAFTVPSHGKHPERQIQSDYVMVPTYAIGNNITWLQEYAKNARWPVLSRAMEVFEMGFVKKKNDDGFHVLLAAAVDRNIVVFDSAASAGQFTKRLVSLLKQTMRRNGGGNSTSVNRGRLTDLWLSPEANEDMRNWGVDQVDDITRREIYVGGDGVLKRVYDVNMHDTDEFGVGQQYQLYLTGTLSASLPSGDVEFMLGLDLSKNDSFVMPTRGGLEVHPFLSLKESWRDGFYGKLICGFGVLDSRRVILGSI